MFIRCMLGCHRTHFTYSMVVSGLPYCMTGLKLMEVRWKYPNWELLLADDLHSELLTIPSAERKSDFTTSSTKKKGNRARLSKLIWMNDSCYKILRTASYIYRRHCFIPRLSLNETGTAIDRFLVTDGLD